MRLWKSKRCCRPEGNGTEGHRFQINRYFRPLDVKVMRHEKFIVVTPLHEDQREKRGGVSTRGISETEHMAPDPWSVSSVSYLLPQEDVTKHNLARSITFLSSVSALSTRAVVLSRLRFTLSGPEAGGATRFEKRASAMFGVEENSSRDVRTAHRGRALSAACDIVLECWQSSESSRTRSPDRVASKFHPTHSREMPTATTSHFRPTK